MNPVALKSPSPAPRIMPIPKEEKHVAAASSAAPPVPAAMHTLSGHLKETSKDLLALQKK